MLLHAFTVLALSLQASAQETPRPPDSLGHAAALEDVLQLGDLLERVHPDPYAGFGGRLAYGRAFQALIDGLPEGAISVADLRQRIALFLSDMGDGHTGIQQLARTSGAVERRYLPVRLTTSADGIVISDALPAYQDLIGARVWSVEGRAVDDLAGDARVFFPSENLSGSRRQLARGLEGIHSADDLLPDLDGRLDLTVTKPGRSSAETVTLPYETTVDARRAGPWVKRRQASESSDPGPFSHRLIADGRVGYLRLSAMWSREAFESMRASGRTDIDQWLTSVYERFIDGARPDDEAEAIAAFPSLIDEVDVLLRTMKAGGTRDLVVDLRANGGGFSIIGEPLLYQLVGGAYLASPSPVFFATRVSDELLAIQGRSLSDLSQEEGRVVRMGDFLLDPTADTTPESADGFLQRHRENGFSRVDVLVGVAEDPGLNVAVVTDAATFSAAFDLAYQLHRMGAILVGVPPSQSPKAFTDSTPFELKNSGLRGSMSRTAVVYPGIASENGAVLMDEPVTWARWVERMMHPDAAVQLAVEALQAGRR